MSPGLQTAQAVHAAFLFATEHPTTTTTWHHDSNYVVVLAVHDLNHLEHEFSRIPEHCARVMVIEPDIGDEPTAFAALGLDAGRILSSLPLAGKQVVMT